VTNSSRVGSGVGTNYLSGVTSGLDFLLSIFCQYCKKQCICPFLWSAVWAMVYDLVKDRKKKSH
jgi:hypothetical protein